MDGVAVAEQVAELDQEILRLHIHAQADETDELAAVLARAQIDELLEQRYRLTQHA